MSRGINAIQKDSELLESQKVKKPICFVGNMPIWHIDDKDWANLAGQAYLVSNIKEVRQKLGYYEPDEGAWPLHSSLCEVVHAISNVNKVAPIILVVNSTATPVDTTDIEKEVVMSGNVGVINCKGLGVLSSVGVEGKVKGTDYSVAYDDVGQNIILTALTEIATEGKVSVTYKSVNVASLTMGEATFEVLDFIEQDLGCIPSCILAPGCDKMQTSGGNTVADELIKVSESQINSHWYSQAIIQLTANTKALAIAEKSTEKYVSTKSKVCWPYVYIKEFGFIYCASTIYALQKMVVDDRNNGIPHESVSNEKVAINQLCTSEGSVIRVNQATANELNNSGIATFNFMNNAWRTWGPFMANYSQDEADKGNIKAEYLSDTAVQMRDFISNDFQEEYGIKLDKQLSVREVKEILNNYQSKLDSYVHDGYLVAGKISFVSDEESTLEIAKGDFNFDIAETSTPIGKSITATVHYDPDALSSYVEQFTEGDEVDE